MARPRGGNFHYTEREWETLIHDAQWLLDHGAVGIAFGCLDRSGQIDPMRCRQMRDLAGSRELVFHKAFDEVPDWKSGLEILIEAGVNRVMTSGQESSAFLGIRAISQIVDRAAGRIEVLPAGRINSQNAVELVDLAGVRQIHGSFTSGPGDDISAEIGLTMDALRTRSI
jgi:copper homeostasis protein